MLMTGMGRSFGWIALATLVLPVLTVTGACVPTQGAGPTLEEAVTDPRQWPTCITRQMKERAFACPAQPALAPPTTSCTPQPEPWPPPPARLEPDAALARQLAGSSPALDHAEAAYAKATGSATTGATNGTTIGTTTGTTTGAEADWRAAQRAFQRLQRDARQSKTLRGYGSYRLGLIHFQLGRSNEGLTALEAAVLLAYQAKPSLQTTAVRATARAALISASAISGDVAGAKLRFQRLWGSDNEGEQLSMLHALGEALAAQGKLGQAAALLSDLARQDAVDSCSHQAKAVRALHARGPKLPTAGALDDLMGHLFATSPGTGRHGRCGATTAQLLVDIGDEWHAEALGTPQRSGTRDPHTMHLAAQLYRVVLATFTQGQLDDWGVCAPLGRIALRRAHLLRARQDWTQCGPAYDEAMRLDPEARRNDEVTFSAVVCRQHAWANRLGAQNRQQVKQRMESALEHTDDWRQLLRAIHRYLCTATARHARSPNYAESALVRAQALYDGGALWEAAVAFRLVAFEHSQALAGGLAAQRYAEVMEPLAADDVCRRELSIDLERLDATYCRPRRATPTECQGLGAVLTRLSAEGLRL
jgi:tetratricopeptide (TPR) repeat protein